MRDQLNDPELEPFESIVHGQLHRLADLAPTTVRRPDEVSLTTGSGTGKRGERRNRRRFAGIGASIIVLAGGVGITSVALNSAGDGGAASPKDAVWKFVDAVQHQDILGAVDVVDPDEVAAVRSAFTDAASQGKRLELVDGSFSLSSVKGVEVTFNDLALDDEQISSDEAVVTATAGSVTTSFDPAAFAFGSVIREAHGTDLKTTSKTAELAGAKPVMLATVKRNGRWYVSVSYTIAEYARRATKAAPLSTTTPPSDGFATPEESVTALYERLLSGNLISAVATAAPGEGDALARSVSLWGESAEKFFAKGTTAGLDLHLTGVKYSTEADGDRRALTPTAFVLSGTVPGSWNHSRPFDPTLPTVIYTRTGGSVIVPAGSPLPANVKGLPTTNEYPSNDANQTSANADGTVLPFLDPSLDLTKPLPIHIERADGCTTFDAVSATLLATRNNTDIHELAGGRVQVCSAAGLGGISAVYIVLAAGTGFTSLPTVATVRVGGQWYVSPIGTVANQVLHILRDVPDRSSLLDSDLAYVIYGTSLQTLQLSLVGHPTSSIDPLCLPIVTSADGTVTAIIGDPRIADVRACGNALNDSTSVSSSSSSSGGGGVVTASTLTPESSVVAAAPDTGSTDVGTAATVVVPASVPTTGVTSATLTATAPPTTG